MRESQSRLEMVLESIADGFYALDREWHFTHVNGAALHHMGKTSKEILGLNPCTLRSRMHKLGIDRPETKEQD